MNTNGNNKALEAHKIFPYIAWGTSLLFALFVYNITLELKDVAENLQIQTNNLQMQANTPVENISDFES